MFFYKDRFGTRDSPLTPMIPFLKKHRLNSWSIDRVRVQGDMQDCTCQSGEQLSLTRCLSCDGGARRRGGSESCLASLTECCDQVWWCTLYVSWFPCDSSCRINILHFVSTPTIYSLLFTYIFFHPHNFNFFYLNAKF